MRILITDDHAVVRQGLKQILAEEFKRAEFGEASNVQEAIDKVWKEPWDVVVLDITMPGRSGLEVLKERLLKIGASGYMTKESAPQELVGAVKKVVAGGRYVSAALAEKMASYLAVDVQTPPHERLSDREFLVLRLIASGKTPTAIAKDLGLSVKTISTYRMRILEKMTMANNAELTHYAIQNQLV
jgi:two-component system, NarL family, invasion response regulator UvrY